MQPKMLMPLRLLVRPFLPMHLAPALQSASAGQTIHLALTWAALQAALGFEKHQQGSGSSAKLGLVHAMLPICRSNLAGHLDFVEHLNTTMRSPLERPVTNAAAPPLRALSFLALACTPKQPCPL